MALIYTTTDINTYFVYTHPCTGIVHRYPRRSTLRHRCPAQPTHYRQLHNIRGVHTQGYWSSGEMLRADSLNYRARTVPWMPGYVAACPYWMWLVYTHGRYDTKRAPPSQPRMSKTIRWTFLKNMHRANVVLWPSYSHSPVFAVIPNTFVVITHTAPVLDSPEDDDHVDGDDDNHERKHD